MAVYVEGGGDLIDALGGGMLDSSTKEWFQHHSNTVRQTLSQTGQTFLDQARNLYQTISESQALQMLRNLRTKHDNVWSGNLIQPLRSLESLQTAGPVMQRWIMAEPTLRQRYLNQEVEGYDDQYINHHGDAVGRDHYDYRRVMNGIVETTNDDEDWVARIYIDDLEEGERELNFHEKLDILDTWDLVKHYLEEGDEDPTSPYGNPL